MAHLVKCLTLGFGSGHDLTACELEPHTRLYAGSVESAWDSLSPSLSDPPCWFSLCLSLSLSFQEIN